MKIGFTGTRNGLTEKQADALSDVIAELNPYEFHHGDCKGADAAAHMEVFLNTRATIIVHPPIDKSNRAFCAPSARVMVQQELPYLVRNRIIVDVSELLVACPHGPEELRSGTWSTVRYARKRGKSIVIAWPNGEITREEPPHA